MNVTFIGGGNMASALITGLLQSGMPPAQIQVIDHNPAARSRLAAQSIRAVEAPEAAALAADVLVLAVKPQQLHGVCAQLRGQLAAPLILSVAAGISTATLTEWLGGYAAVVRAMPNTPAQVSRGISGVYATAAVQPAQKEMAEQILAAAGSVVWVPEEAALDAITAISGSGPAYVFQFMEALAQAAEEMGFDAATARHLVLETFAGATALAAASAEPLATLRQKVTSKGGTTERALLTMAEREVAGAIRAGAHAARARAEELGRELAKIGKST